MKIITSLLIAIMSISFACVVAAIAKEEERTLNPYDSDEDGGFLDDWRLP